MTFASHSQVHIVCLSLSFKVTEWLRWQGGIPFATFQDGIKFPAPATGSGSRRALRLSEGTRRNVT